MGFDWFLGPVDAFTSAGIGPFIPGGPVPELTVDSITGSMTANLSSWFVDWNDAIRYQGTGINDGWTSPQATGLWNPVDNAFSLQ